MSLFIIFSKVSVIFLLIFVGFILTRKNIIRLEAQHSFTNLLLFAFLPAALIKAFNVPFDRLVLTDGIKVTLIMSVVYIVATIIAFYISKLLTKNPQKQDVYIVGMVLPNVTFMGYPIIESLLGPEYLFYIVMGNIPFEIISWTFFARLFAKHGDGSANNSILRTLATSPPLVSITFAIIMYVSQLSIPEPFISTINYLANGMTPVAMIIVGMSLAKANIKDLVLNKGLYLASAVRLIVFPFAVFMVLKQLGFSGPTLIIPTIVFAMPTAGYTNIIANKFGSDATFAAEFIALCTLLSLVSIPIIMSLF